jgi:hypothetical protein
MALSARMLAFIQKIEAADAAHFAGLRETARKEFDARAKTKTVEKESGEPPRGARSSSSQEEAQHLVAKKYTHALRRRTLAIIREIDAQTESVNARGKRREDAKNAARRAKARAKNKAKG